MNGCSSESAVIVNAEVDSMGGVIDSGDGIGGSKCSLRLTAFERAQVELRQEYDFREKSRRELEFLEKGGNPLDFKFGGGASLSVQSTSLTDQHREHVTSEAKDSFVLTASPHGDSVESSGRPGIPTVSEPNTADNLFLLDGKNESRESEMKLTHTTKKSCIVLKEHGSQMNGTQNAKESEDSAIVRPYARRNRSKINRDSARSNSAAMIQTRGSSHGFLHTRGAPKAKSTSEVNNQKEQNIIVVGNKNRKSTTSNGYIGSKLATSDTQMNTELECAPSKEVTNYKTNDSGPEAKIDTPSGGPNSSAEIGMQGLNSESPCTQNSLTVDVNNGSDMCLNPKVADSNEFPLEQGSVLEGIANVDLVKEKNDIFEAEVTAIDNNDVKSVNQNRSVICPIIKVEKEANRSTPDLQNGLDYFSKVNAERNDSTISETDRRMDIPVSEPEASVSGRKLIDAPYAQMGDKAYEDSILEQARIIEAKQAKQKSVAELSAVTLPLENHHQNHWYFVLEEMAWLANDFAQERLWKMTAASQICRRVALTSRLRFEGKTQCLKLKQIAYVLAKDVMRFWHSAEMLRNTDHPISGVKSYRQDVSVEEPGVQGQEAFKENPQSTKTQAFAVQKYAVRFLVSNSDSVPTLQAEAEATPDRNCDLATAEISWDEYRNEESLFYAVPSGAMKSYRESIESHFMQCEKTASSIQEEVETSTYDAPGEMRYQAPGYDEDEGEASAYYLSGGFEGRKSIKSPHKKRKKSYNSRTYEIGTDLPYVHCPNEAQQSVLTLKRPAGSLHVDSFPTKRVRTASRQRIVGPFNGAIQVPIKKDASSGDTNSFQDDQCTQNGGSQFQKSMEVESVGGDFEKQLPYDCAETSTKPKKKKKPKTMGTSYEQGWQLDASVHNQQRDQSRRRLDSDNLESNGTGGLNGQHGVKKPKIMKQQAETTLDNMNMGSIPSPAASQMSNMPNPSKLIKLISGRDRGIKTKGLKASSEQPGSGSPWFLFEDQALVVLVHDMGPNWELVSDALNSTLQFKCIYRKPKECKERYKSFTDRSGADEADSAEDSGSPSYTLPGIPKGSARQLFRHLQSPMEEDTLRAHFEKIISIGKKQHQRKRQNENQDSKQMVPVHNSHLIALSQVCSNNLNGGLLTPLDLCDAASSPDGAPFGYHGGAAIANQGGAASIHPSPVANPSLQATPDMLLSNSSPSLSGSLAPPMRDGRYNSPRMPLPVDEQQRMQQCNQMFSARSLQQTNLSVPGADRAVRMLPGGNGMGMMVNRSLPMPRPGLRGIPSPSGGSMLSSNVVGMPNPVNKINSGAGSGSGSGQGRSVLRPGEPLHMMRPGQNGEHHQRQLMAPEVQMQGNGQGMAAFNGLSYQGHPHPQHQLSPRPLINPHLQGPNNTAGAQHQYAARLAKQRHHMQQQQFTSTSPPMQHAASQPPVSAPPMSAMSSQEHHLTPQGLNRNPKTVAGSGLTNQMGKQRQRQQLQQSGRHHPQQQQSQQHLKVLKGNGKNLSVDPSNRLNGLSSPPGNQSMEKGDQTIPSMPGQGLYAGSIRPSKPLPSPLSSNIYSRPLQKLYSAPTPALKLDNCSPSRITFSDRHQTVLPPITKQPLPRQLTQTHSAVQRVLQQNSQENSGLLGKSQVDELSRPDSAPVSSESVYNSGKSNVTTQSSSNGSPPRASSSNSDLVPNVGLEQRQLSDSLPSPGHNVGPQSQDEQKPPQQLPLEQETQ